MDAAEVFYSLDQTSWAPSDSLPISWQAFSTQTAWLQRLLCLGNMGLLQGMHFLQALIVNIVNIISRPEIRLSKAKWDPGREATGCTSEEWREWASRYLEALKQCAWNRNQFFTQTRAGRPVRDWEPDCKPKLVFWQVTTLQLNLNSEILIQKTSHTLTSSVLKERHSNTHAIGSLPWYRASEKKIETLVVASHWVFGLQDKSYVKLQVLTPWWGSWEMTFRNMGKVLVHCEPGFVWQTVEKGFKRLREVDTLKWKGFSRRSVRRLWSVKMP